jgi:hypothetical protein
MRAKVRRMRRARDIIRRLRDGEMERILSGLRFVKMIALRLQSMSATESLASPAPKANREAVTENHSARLMCLEVFRALAVAGMILVDNPGSDQKAHHLITHAEWNDWTPADFIFHPFFFLSAYRSC